MKNVRHSFPEAEVTSSNSLFYLTNSPKPKDIQFTFIYDEEKHQIITFQNLEPADVWYFWLKHWIHYHYHFCRWIFCPSTNRLISSFSSEISFRQTCVTPTLVCKLLLCPAMKQNNWKWVKKKKESENLYKCPSLPKKDNISAGAQAESYVVLIPLFLDI